MISWCQDLLYSRILSQKLVFIVDPRPIGYESNIYVHIVRAISDDSSIIKIFQDASNINEEKLVPLDPCLPQISLEFKYNLTMVFKSTSEGPLASGLPLDCV
ncbi:hypothetical protein PIB30_043480 [Stylosanthes scabra]|uniref:Uncharacterized protein n=1 Tax=Stylosanthes scabra TaxID=79078 RepID=A0ABU6ZE96_9FABA|nr:hypothetical protein [Stylosanthes scabra]